MALISPYVSIITLNVNGLNLPIERHRVAGWIKKLDPTVWCLQETHTFKDIHKLKVKEWKKMFYENENQRKVEVDTYVRHNR